MNILNEADENAAYETALKLYSYLKSYEDFVTDTQNLLLFVSKFKSTIFYITMNLLFLLFYFCHFSIFCYVLIIIAIRAIPIYYLKKIISSFLKLFSPSDNEKRSSKALPLDHLCCLLSIIHQEFRIFFRHNFEAIQNGQLYDIAFLTFINFSIFYITYFIGDALFVWIVFHLINLLPLILTKRIGFDLFNFPVKSEKKNLNLLRIQIEKDRQEEIIEENKRRAEEVLRQNEEVKRFAEIAKYNEEVERNILMKHSTSSSEFIDQNNENNSVQDFISQNEIPDVSIPPNVDQISNENDEQPESIS